ncbi:eryC1 [Symbiodinium microadriaticum]|nr:eryC1 [Symbiodinium microadriaticum]
MHDMYNMNFDRAARQYNYLKKLYGWHPLPYFLLGLNEWWKLLPYGITDETEWDATFLAYMDSAEVLSKRLYEEVNELEGAFFLSAVYAFQGRLYSDRGDYVKAALVGKKCLKYLEITRGNSEFSPEILFGDALFNYYAKWIREHYPYLKPLMAFFPDGDKKKGIEQLEETARNAFYSRTEAQYYLMRILYAEEGDLEGALQIARYLHEQYPNNAYFHRFFVRLTYQKGNFKEAEEEALEIIQRIDLGWPGYEWNSGRYAGFFLGHIYEVYKKPEDAMKYYNYAIEYGELAGTTEIKVEIDQAVQAVLSSGWYHGGEEVQIVEKKLQKIIGSKHCIGVGSGYDGLYVSLKSMGIVSGDEVITTAFSWVATANAIVNAGAKPVFVDIRKDTFNLDEQLIEEAITEKTKAIIPVHIYGLPSELGSINEIAEKFGLKVIEDAAQAIGARYHGKAAGNIGDAGVISFYPTKQIGAYGDAGCVLTDDDNLANRIRTFANQGKSEGEFVSSGVTSRLDRIQAAILSVKLDHLDRWLARRREIASQYQRALVGKYKVQHLPEDLESSWYNFAIVSADRDEIRRKLDADGIGWGANYEIYSKTD